MKLKLWLAIGAVAIGGGVLFAVGILERSAERKFDPASLLPEGALLSIEANDFSSLLHDWNGSQEKRAWIAGDNYEAFSRSRLFERLAQAQSEFSEVATVDVNSGMLEAIAGKQSCLGLYDIGRLEFVYITRMETSRIESLPLWLARDKFERRNEAGSDFYLRKDAKSDRQAAFAERDGWLILGTREDLVAGVLDRIAGKADHNLANEGWYAEAVKQAGERGELRMTLNLSRIVPSPYFRSYWIQRNITEMKQYAAAVADLRRDGAVYREERVLLRREGSGEQAQGDAQPLFTLAPDDSVLTIAQTIFDREQLLQNMREDLLELRPQAERSGYNTAPSAAAQENAGNASQLDVTIDQAPVVESRADVDQPLRALLDAAGPVRAMRCYSSASSRDNVFVALNAAMVLDAQTPWNEEAVRNALTAALAPATTVSGLGAQWQKRSGGAGEYLALDGPVNLYLKTDGSRLFLSSDAALLENLLLRARKTGAGSPDKNRTYLAIFRNGHGRTDFLRIMQQLDRAGANGVSPAFFSGNIGSLTRAFDRLDSEQVAERDLGSKVLQTIAYTWKD